MPNDARESIDGDLHELYIERRASSGIAVANLWYWLESFSFVMRFSIDRMKHGIRGLFGGNPTPSMLDLKLGARMLAKSPGLTIVGGFGIAVGVALGTGAYAVINTYFYPTLPLNEGDRVVALGKFHPGRQYKDSRLLHDFLVWRRELRQVVDLGAFRTVSRNIITETGQADPITLAEMTASGFRVARVPPLRGRVLLESDERPGAPPVVVIGYDIWQTRFAGDPAVLGREIRIGRTAHTIVGVMPQGFGFPVNHKYWIPLLIDPGAIVDPAGGPNLDAFARLAPGATKETAQAELSVLGSRLAATAPAELAELVSRIIPYTDIVFNGAAMGEISIYSRARFFIAFLLVVVAMNVAVLVYARTVARTSEIAVRTALGATRGRIVAQLFAEAFVLSGISALVGLAAVAAGLRMFDRFFAEQGGAPFWIDSGLSFGAVLYALALAVLSAVIVGVFPALRATGAQLRGAMGSLGGGAKARLGPTWTALIVVQITIAVAILPPALAKGSQTVHEAFRPSGFAKGEYVSAGLSVDRDATASGADSTRSIVNTLLARVASEPGVVGVTVTAYPPWEASTGTMDVDGASMPSPRLRIFFADTSYFATFGVRVLAGRSFNAGDAALRPNERPVIVNRSFVTEVLAGGDAIGRRIRYASDNGQQNPWLTIAGVVEDFPESANTPADRARMLYHLVLADESASSLLMVRLRGQTPESFTPSLRRIAVSIDPILQLTDPSPLDIVYQQYARGAAQLAIVVALVAGSVLLLSAAGIHALMSFTVNQRRREIGIRSALGASARRVLTSVLARAMRQLALGVGLGLTMAVVLELSTGGEMMNGAGLLLVPGTALFMLVVGIVAAAGPARRGLHVEPTEALRSE